MHAGMTPVDHPFRVLPFTTGAAGLPPNETTFATVAKRQGYNTALIGLRLIFTLKKRLIFDFCLTISTLFHEKFCSQLVLRSLE
jgi:hypothetical protein